MNTENFLYFCIGFLFSICLDYISRCIDSYFDYIRKEKK